MVALRSHLCRQQPLTALRLEVWLRSLLCSADHSRFDAAFDIEKSFPDVFRTARVLARAIARHASAIVAGNKLNQGERGGGPTHHAPYPFGSGGGSGAAELLRLDRIEREPEGGERLDSPRRALAGRLRGAPAAGALVSWVSSVVRTAQQYRRWLPWQAFADELRELVLLSAPRQSVGGDGDAGRGGALEAEAAVFAVCELLLAWEEEGEVRTHRCDKSDALLVCGFSRHRRQSTLDTSPNCIFWGRRNGPNVVLMSPAKGSRTGTMVHEVNERRPRVLLISPDKLL